MSTFVLNLITNTIISKFDRASLTHSSITLFIIFHIYINCLLIYTVDDQVIKLKRDPDDKHLERED